MVFVDSSNQDAEIESIDITQKDDHEQNQEELEDLFAPGNAVDWTMVQLHIGYFESQSIDMMLTRDAGKDIIPIGWNEGPSKGDIRVVYGDVVGSAWATMKTEGPLPTSVENAVQVLAKPENVSIYDDMTKKAEKILSISDHTDLRYVEAYGIMFTSPRDFCVATTIKYMENGQVIIATRSVLCDQCEPRYGYVRATMILSGYIITPVEGEPNKCTVALIAHMDFGGYLPATVIKYIGLSAPIKIIERLQEMAAESNEK